MEDQAPLNEYHMWALHYDLESSSTILGIIILLTHSSYSLVVSCYFNTQVWMLLDDVDDYDDNGPTSAEEPEGVHVPRSTLKFSERPL